MSTPATANRRASNSVFTAEANARSGMSIKSVYHCDIDARPSPRRRRRAHPPLRSAAFGPAAGRSFSRPSSAAHTPHGTAVRPVPGTEGAAVDFSPAHS